jgi:hypothetical protein
MDYEATAIALAVGDIPFNKQDLHVWPTPGGDAMLWWYRGRTGVTKDGIVYEYTTLADPMPIL